MQITQIVAVGLVSALLAVTLKKLSPEMALVVSLSACLLLFFMILPMLSQAVTILKNVGALVDTDTEYFGVILKIIGIAYIAELGAQVCTDAGEKAIASKIELSGKVLIMVASAPILMSLLEMLTGIMP